METYIVQTLAESEDGNVRAIMLRRLLRAGGLEEEERRMLREHLPQLSPGELIEVVERHGDLGCPAAFVDQLVAAMPSDHDQQLSYFLFCLGGFDVLPCVLDQDAYADFVEKSRGRLSQDLYRTLVEQVRGGALFNAVTAKDRDRTSHERWLAPEPLATLLFEVRPHDRACRERLEAPVTDRALDRS